MPYTYKSKELGTFDFLLVEFESPPGPSPMYSPKSKKMDLGLEPKLSDLKTVS